MKRHRGEKDKGEALNITPMIDVVFLLLIFFIATIQLPDPEDEMRAYLPKEEVKEQGASDQMDEQEDPNVIPHTIVLEPNRILVGQIDLGRDWEALKGYLDEWRLEQASSDEVEHEIVLVPAANTPYHMVIRALKICANYGFEDVNFGKMLQGTAE
jgi:biopolymer transport protein ExbD